MKDEPHVNHLLIHRVHHDAFMGKERNPVSVLVCILEKQDISPAEIRDLGPSVLVKE